MKAPEPWLRGPVEGITPGLQPVAHELLFAREELSEILPRLTSVQVWQRAGAIAPIGYHVRHCCGSTERMLTYIRKASLDEAQLAALRSESEDRPDLDGAALLDLFLSAIDRALDAARSTREAELGEAREVGRQKLPSTVRGLFYEIAVHTARHVGQIATTAKLV